MKRCSVLLILLSSSYLWAATPKKLEAFPEGERLVYTRLLEAYRKNHLNEVVAQRQLLERNYPSSVYLDQAYYLTGKMHFDSSQFAEAVRDFGVIRSKYAKSAKRPAALFATGMTYKRLNLPGQARLVLNELIREYPGSPESQRAWMELKLIPTRTK